VDRTGSLRMRFPAESTCPFGSRFLWARRPSAKKSLRVAFYPVQVCPHWPFKANVARLVIEIEKAASLYHRREQRMSVNGGFHPGGYVEPRVKSRRKYSLLVGGSSKPVPSAVPNSVETARNDIILGFVVNRIGDRWGLNRLRKLLQSGNLFHRKPSRPLLVPPQNGREECPTLLSSMLRPRTSGQRAQTISGYVPPDDELCFGWAG